MRVALISDIHANLVSLDAVLADIHKQQVDQIVCLGDVATIGPDPHGVIARLRDLACPCVMGNHDAFLLDSSLVYAYTNEPFIVQMVDWCASQLSEADYAYLRAFEPLFEIALGDQATLVCFHGSPRSNTDIILATTSPVNLDRMLAGHVATVMAGGHTHLQMLRQHKGMVIVGVGSVGSPLEKMPFKGTPRILPWAEYAIVGWTGEVLDIALRRVRIDFEAFKHSVLSSGMPDAADWVKYWII